MDFDSLGLECSLRAYISNELPDDVDVADPCTDHTLSSKVLDKRNYLDEGTEA